MILTILNTIAIVYLFFKHAGFYVSLRKDKTFEALSISGILISVFDLSRLKLLIIKGLIIFF